MHVPIILCAGLALSHTHALCRFFYASVCSLSEGITCSETSLTCCRTALGVLPASSPLARQAVLVHSMASSSRLACLARTALQLSSAAAPV